MPGIPLVTRETSSYSRSTLDQMCREDARGGAVLHLTEEEEIAAEESLSIYCKPVELYNILQRRSIGNPSFLQRCLLYKIQAKNKRRIQMTISMLVTLNGVVQSHNIFPLYVLLARLVSNIGVLEYSEVYRFSQPCVLTGFAGVEGSTQVQAHFVLPEMNKLASEVKSGSLHVLLVSFENVGGCCLLGKIPLDSLCNFWEKSPNLGLGQRAEVTSPVDMNACFLKLNCLTEDNCVLIQIPFNSETVVCSALKGLLVGQNQIHLSHLLLDVSLLTEVSHFYCLCFPKNTSQLQVNISAEEVGAKEKSSYTCSDMSSSSSHVIRLRVGNVIFNYRYYNNKLQKTEVTEDFSCPFCLVKCASFKGLRYHLPSSHDLFNFEFWITQEFQAVNISVNTDIWRSKIVADGIDPKQQTFFCSKKPKRKKPKNLIPNAKNAHDKTLSRQWGAGELLDKIGGGKDLPATSMCGTEYGEHNLSRFYVSGVSGSAAQAYPDAECVEMVPGNNLAPPAMLQFAKTRKLSIERSDMRNRTLLHKRQFFHSHRAQSMETEQVMSDRDSEDEVDDDVADFEDRRMLDDFVDVTKDEKQMMHLWNSFVRKQRVLADGHIPWACEAFTRLHGHDLFLTPALMWCWRLFMIKLWNHGLLDARTMNLCNMILEQYQKQDLDPMKN
ncbi:polycomb group protein EMBRYONIC FLOWER 2 isoform X4 [Populus alba]|uniref:polycomb group protein EMBRYONIC FLOWER 2 isoform X4 n=1 Tax=Populus alba TaxID=43335 RepID=UPI003CC797FC